MSNQTNLPHITNVISDNQPFSKTDEPHPMLAEALLTEQNRVLEMVARGASLASVLEALTLLIEKQADGMLCSILLLDEDGLHLRRGAAPSLPVSFSQAVDGLAIGPKAGSCGAAAYLGQAVFTPDITTDPIWQDYRELALSYELRACWSTPIISTAGRVLGTFAMYYREVRHPSADELRLIEIATGLAGIAIERKRTEAELTQRAAHLALINDIGRKIAALLDLDSVLNSAARLVQQMFGYHHVALFLLAEERANLKAIAGSYETYFPPGHSQKLSQGIIGWVGIHGEKVVANDVGVEPRYISLIADRTVTRTELCLPIKVAEQTVGMLDLQSPRLNAFSENDIMAMETLTDQIAVAIENARLYEAMQKELIERKQAELERARYEAQLQGLAEASLLINSTLSLQKIFKIVTQKARDIVGAHQSIMSTTVDEKWAQAIQQVSLSDKYATYREFAENHDGSGIYQLVCQINCPMHMTQAEWEEHPVWQGFGNSASQHPPLRGWLAAPLIGGYGHNLGLIQVSDKYEGDFTANDEVLLAQLAQMASVALENVRLYEAEYHVRQLAETLRAANLALTQTLDPKIVLETLLDHLGRLIPYDSASVFLLELETCLALRASRGYQIKTASTGVDPITFDTRLNPIFHALLITRQSVLIADTTQHPGWERLVGTEYIRNWLGVPLVAGGQVIGVYGLDKAEPNFFTPEHQRLAEALAAQAAVAIQNAQLFAQVQAGGQRLETLSQRLLEVQEAERRHIARELHDEIGQLLTGLQLVLEAGVRSPTVQITSRLNEAQALVGELMDHIHELSLELRPTLLDDLGLLPALLTHFERYTKQTRIQVKFRHSGLAERRFAPKIETAAYRLVQEALTNVARHAEINQVMVSLWSDNDTLQIQVEDQGVGFDPQVALARGTSSGLTGMRERVMLLGGQFIFDSTPGAGACLTAELPLAPEESV